MVEYCLKLAHDLFLPHPSHTTTTNHPILQCYVIVAIERIANKPKIVMND
jgi:hypothetical protein